MDASITSRKKQPEKTWMVKLGTVYHYGLNDRLGDKFKKEHTCVLASKRFTPFTWEMRTTFVDQFIKIKLKHHLSRTLSYFPKVFRVSFLIMSKYNLKNTAVLLQDNIDDERHSIQFIWYSLALDIIETKMFKLTISKAKRKAPNNICKVSFLNKGMELINVLHLFHDLSVKVCLPAHIKLDDPTVLC